MQTDVLHQDDIARKAVTKGRIDHRVPAVLDDETCPRETSEYTEGPPGESLPFWMRSSMTAPYSTATLQDVLGQILVGENGLECRPHVIDVDHELGVSARSEAS